LASERDTIRGVEIYIYIHIIWRYVKHNSSVDTILLVGHSSVLLATRLVLVCH